MLAVLSDLDETEASRQKADQAVQALAQESARGRTLFDAVHDAARAQSLRSRELKESARDGYAVVWGPSTRGVYSGTATPGRPCFRSARLPGRRDPVTAQPAPADSAGLPSLRSCVRARDLR